MSFAIIQNHISERAYHYAAGAAVLVTAAAASAYTWYKHYNSTDRQIREIFRELHITDWHLPGVSSSPQNQFENVQPYFKPETTRDLARVTEMIKHALSNPRISIPSLILEGEPGVGKTAFVKSNCQNTGIGYIYLPTGLMEDLIKRGTHIQILRRICEIAKMSLTPTVLVLDDGEELVGQRPPGAAQEIEIADESAPWQKNQASLALTITQRRIALVNAFLDIAGTEGSQIAIVVTTNRGEAIDKAFWTRCTVLKIDPPGIVERKNIINRHLPKFVTDLRILRFFDARVVADMAASTEGFVGRDLVLLLKEITTCAQMENDITQEIIDASIIHMQKSVLANKIPTHSMPLVNSITNSPVVVKNNIVSGTVQANNPVKSAKVDLAVTNEIQVTSVKNPFKQVQSAHATIHNFVSSVFQSMGCC